MSCEHEAHKKRFIYTDWSLRKTGGQHSAASCCAARAEPDSGLEAEQPEATFTSDKSTSSSPWRRQACSS